MRTLYAILIAVLIAGGAQAETKRVGQWIVKAERDPFSDQINVFVMTFNNSGGLAFRCLHGDPSIALNQARAKYQEGDEFEIALRVDRR